MNPSKRRVLRRFRCFSRAAFTMALLSRWSRDSSATTSAASCLSARDVSFLAAARSRTARSTVAAAYGLRRPRWDRAQGVAYLSLRHSKRPPSTAFSSTESSQTCRAVSGNCRLRFESAPSPRPSSGGGGALVAPRRREAGLGRPSSGRRRKRGSLPRRRRLGGPPERASSYFFEPRRAAVARQHW